MNENGVVVVTNNCNITIEEKEKFNDGGIGYGIRRLVAEYATSAHHGVDIVIELMEKYFHMGHTYTIADKNDAWQIALLRGHRYLARKVKDNEIAFIINVVKPPSRSGYKTAVHRIAQNQTHAIRQLNVKI